MPLKSRSTSLGRLLREWRRRRGVSQLDLSIRTGVSQRHISFIESGRSHPSRETLLTLAESLEVPLRERNELLLAAGFAPIYAADRWDADQLAIVRSAVRRMLVQHDPFPAVVMDRYWNVLQANASAPHFFGTFFDFASRKGPRNLLHLLFDPAGLRPFVVDWEQTAKLLLDRVHRESPGQIVDPTMQAVLDALKRYPASEATELDDEGVPAVPSPIVPVRFRHAEGVLSYFSLITTVGTPQAIAAQEMRIECMFPADAETERRHRSIMEGFVAGEPH